MMHDVFVQRTTVRAKYVCLVSFRHVHDGGTREVRYRSLKQFGGDETVMVAEFGDQDCYRG